MNVYGLTAFVFQKKNCITKMYHLVNTMIFYISLNLKESILDYYNHYIVFMY